MRHALLALALVALADAALYPYPADGPVVELLTQPPPDEDFRTLWPRGSIIAVDEGEVQIDGSVPADRPRSMTEREATLTVQQVLYTLRDSSGQEIDRVRFVRDGAPAASVWGVETHDGVVDLQPPLAVLSFLNLAEPLEGAAVRDSFTATGEANGFEGSVSCLIEDEGGNRSWSGATIAGWQEERLFPWHLEVDLTDIVPGTYRFRCLTDDPTGGAEGAGSAYDTRTIVVGEPTPVEPAPGDPPRPVFYVGDTVFGPRLFQSLVPNDTGEPDHGSGILVGHLMSTPPDPDYRTLWVPGSLVDLGREIADGRLALELSDAGIRSLEAMTAAEATLAVQQVAYSFGGEVAQLVDEEGREVRPVETAPELEVRSLVNLDSPAEGQVVRDRFVASGMASSFEGTVGWEFRDRHGEVLLRGSAQGGGEVDRLNPFAQTIDVTLLARGTYTFTAMTDDPVGDGMVYTDTRTVLVR